MGTATHLLTQRVAFQAPAGANVDGDPVYGALQTIACRYVRKVETVRGAAGMTTQEATIIVTERDIPANSLVWIDGVGAGDRKQARLPSQRAVATKPFGGYALFETRL